MKRLISIFFVFLFLIAACEKVDESKRPKMVTKEVAAVMSDKASQERDEFVRKTLVELDELSIILENFAQSAKKESGEMKKEMDQKLKGLKERHSEALQKIAEIKLETTENWHELKAGVSNAVDDLKQDLQGNSV